MKWKLLPVIMIAAILLSAATALADGDIYAGGPLGTKITYLPYIINSNAPGAYYLGSNLSTSSGDGITINADNVTLDLMGYTLSYTGTGQQNGISMNGRTNVEIRNGTLTGWNWGVHETGTGNRIINIRSTAAQDAISVAGTGLLIKGCEATVTGGGSAIIFDGFAIVNGCIAKCNTGIGIYAFGGGSGGIVSGNVVGGTDAASSKGILIFGHALVQGNEVSNCNIGIDLVGYGSDVIGNTVNTASSGDTGISGSNLSATVLDQNTVIGAGTHTAQITNAKTRNNAW